MKNMTKVVPVLLLGVMLGGLGPVMAEENTSAPASTSMSQPATTSAAPMSKSTHHKKHARKHSKDGSGKTSAMPAKS